MFGKNDNGNVAIFCDDGTAITRNANWWTLYPVGSQLSCAYEHPQGIVLSRQDTEYLHIEIE